MSNISRKKPKWHVHLGDFANMLKAFIGSNYLSVPFAFLQTGLGLGIAGLILIASLTDHCCHLLVKTKYHAINKVMRMYKEKQKSDRKHLKTHSRCMYNTGVESDNSHPSGNSMFPALFNSLSEDDSDSNSDIMKFKGTTHTPKAKVSPALSNEEDDIITYDIDTASMMEHHMLKHMSYGDVGRISMGKAGLYIVNICICVTQFCFCVTYFIFIGNTIYSLFPTKVCVDAGNYSVLNNTSVICNKHYTRYLSTTEVPHLTQRVQDIYNSSPLMSPTVMMAVVMNTTGNGLDTFDNITPNTSVTTGTTIWTTGQSSTAGLHSTVTTFQQKTTTASLNQNITEKYVEKLGPSLEWMVISPLPIFILFALIRSIRNMGWISVLADVSIFVGCVSVLGYILYDFEIHHDYVWVNWEGLPIFFGMVTASYEGIGLIIPVESSMEGNRHRFGAFLHGAVGLVSLILALFAVLGYLRFGSDIQQMLNTNIPPSTWVSFSTNICVVIGVVLTFPLQIYPVIEMVEIVLFTEGQVCGPKKKKGLLDNDDEEENKSNEDDTSLLPQLSVDLPVAVAAHIPDSVSAWKRNIVRVILVLMAASLAVIFRDSFAYVGAFTGAVGSSLLAFILPCLFHVKLCYHDLPTGVIIKDIIIIILGVCCSIVSLVSVIQRLINSTVV